MLGAESSTPYSNLKEMDPIDYCATLARLEFWNITEQPSAGLLATWWLLLKMDRWPVDVPSFVQPDSSAFRDFLNRHLCVHHSARKQ